jgi:hypothetical protein
MRIKFYMIDGSTPIVETTSTVEQIEAMFNPQACWIRFAGQGPDGDQNVAIRAEHVIAVEHPAR